ncbi:hypothetical protein SAMN05421736_11190 [Evansella caseinilytica]|uniref:PEGA domain-containing protein n=1 Tax=Evansella caseinilytica TaxID=1503961 RepID=A0A1H3SKN5_9BACI|nr:hypothetical protein [Evansella caseinilytica]SDZ38566.1 hypothetical protein SAMN05421736_11190 [Evansella caseinilytica]
MKQKTYIEISRTSQYVNKLGKFSVLIDGVERGKIKDGESVRMGVLPGEHLIEVKVDWCISEALTFTLHEGEVRKFRCGSPLRGWKIFFVLYYVLFLPKKYLFIEQAGSGRSGDESSKIS